jgi:hypothetical protein
MGIRNSKGGEQMLFCYDKWNIFVYQKYVGRLSENDSNDRREMLKREHACWNITARPGTLDAFEVPDFNE